MKLSTLATVARRALVAQGAGDTLAAPRLRAYVLKRIASISEAFGRKLTRSTFEAVPVEQLPRELLAACRHPAVRRVARARALEVSRARRSADGVASVRAYRGWVTRSERDEAVTCNIPPELLPLWGRVRASITGDTPHARFEAFMEYAEEHPSEAIAALQDAADEKLATMIRTRGAA